MAYCYLGGQEKNSALAEVLVNRFESLTQLVDGSDNAYTRQRLRGFPWLRFEPELECEYRELNYQGFQRTRNASALLLIVALLGFLMLDIVYGYGAQFPPTSFFAMALRSLTVLFACVGYWQVRDESRVHIGERWIVAVLGFTGFTSILMMLVYARYHQEFHLPLLLDAVILLMITVLFPVGLSVHVGMGMALLIALSAWLLTPWVSGHLMDQQYVAFMPFQVASLVALMALRYYHERSFRTLFLLRGSLHEMASTDALTGLFNRRAFDALARQALAQSAREARLCALLLIDVDHFKRYNDVHGHPAGDQALKAIAKRLHDFPRRPLDLAARMGGEEFVLLFADVDKAFVARIGAHVCEAVRALGIGGEGGPLTISVGVALGPPGCSLDGLYEQADQAMYQAKQQGRDRAYGGADDRQGASQGRVRS